MFENLLLVYLINQSYDSQTQTLPEICYTTIN